MTLPDLICPKCGSPVKQSSCGSCRRRKIHSYKCQKCGTLVENPEYQRT